MGRQSAADPQWRLHRTDRSGLLGPSRQHPVGRPARRGVLRRARGLCRCGVRIFGEWLDRQLYDVHHCHFELVQWDLPGLLPGDRGHNPTDIVFSWSSEVPYLPSCEASLGDTCTSSMPIIYEGQSASQSSCNAQADAPAVGIAANPAGGGYWIATLSGQVIACGKIPFFGDAFGETMGQPVVGIAVTPTGNGYILVTANGSVYTFGSASFHGSLPGLGIVPDGEVVGVGIDPGTGGYWLATSDGGSSASTYRSTVRLPDGPNGTSQDN